MIHTRKIIVLIVIAYAGIFSIMIINENQNPVTYALLVTIIVTLILSLVFVTKSMNKEKKEKDATD